MGSGWWGRMKNGSCGRLLLVRVRLCRVLRLLLMLLLLLLLMLEMLL